MEIKIRPVGFVRSPFIRRGEAPHQGRLSMEESEIHIFPEYRDALEGVELFRHLFVLYWQHLAERDVLKVVPRGKNKKRGVFSTRAPARPNPIGLCLVELLESGTFLRVRGLDALDGSPVIDIKPYHEDIDSPGD
ncbi:tRNA (N6-threonylcarbamoyladenosine(37)-N6)-methyltransferase TrmO [Methanothermobacter sp.]|uniref:tRNA (N6-threonylcarbamoyladenosine(37)-N6)-methyltransferase TrmO n=1 Tax=Methanothermobacter sp. TaxID=1884223 RepID=UPI003C70EF6D